MAYEWNRAASVSAALLALALAGCKGASPGETAIPDEPSGTGYDAPVSDPGAGNLGGSHSVESTPMSRTHVVKKGDTLFALARQYYGGDQSQWKKILAANSDRISNKDQLKVGQELVIPD